MAHQRRYESERELAAWLAGCDEERTGPGAAGVAEMGHDSLPVHDPSSCRERSPGLQSRRNRRYDPRGARSDVVAPSAPPGTQQARQEQAPKATKQLPKPRHPSEGTCKMRCTFYHSYLCPSSKNPETIWIDRRYKPKPKPAPAPTIVPLVAIPSVIPVNNGIKLWEDSGAWGADALEMVNWEDFALENAWRERKQAGSG
ncbi:hypothetical protein LZ554_004062 [Drepanopeziza brunnea f. sp. 'monogermtubi']|nr:hypothetical protein LZ554_004062 [Drepanopeziza brunnea f. sp. 'monogermtubi']